MKTLASAFLFAAAFVAGGCAAETTAASAAGAPAEQLTVSDVSSGGARHEMSAAADRESGASMRGERGIPTPQPARDPGMLAIPVPQPPLPGPDHHGSSTSYESRW